MDGETKALAISLLFVCFVVSVLAFFGGHFVFAGKELTSRVRIDDRTAPAVFFTAETDVNNSPNNQQYITVETEINKPINVYRELTYDYVNTVYSYDYTIKTAEDTPRGIYIINIQFDVKTMMTEISDYQTIFFVVW